MVDQDLKDAALDFEAKKVRLNQTKDGVMLTLAIHPDDAPERLFRCPVGVRFYIVAVEVDDEEQPVVPPEVEDARRKVTTAVMLCKNPKFQNWMWVEGKAGEPTEDAVTDALKVEIGATSRSAIGKDPDVRHAFDQLLSEFEESTRGMP